MDTVSKLWKREKNRVRAHLWSMRQQLDAERHGFKTRFETFGKPKRVSGIGDCVKTCIEQAYFYTTLDWGSFHILTVSKSSCSFDEPQKQFSLIIFFIALAMRVLVWYPSAHVLKLVLCCVFRYSTLVETRSVLIPSMNSECTYADQLGLHISTEIRPHIPTS